MNSIISKLIQFYQNNKQLITLIGVCVMAAIITGLVGDFLCNPPIKETIQKEIPEVKELRDRNNKLVAIIEQKELDKKADHALIDSLAFALKTKPRFIKGIEREVVRVDTVWRDSVEYIVAKTPHDSTVISYKDPYVSILAVGKVPKKNSYVKFGLTPDTTTRVTIYRNPLFGRPIEQKYIVHTNPYFVTTHGDYYEEKQRRAIATIGWSVLYDPFQKRVATGPSLTVPLKTFYSKK